MKAKNGPRSMKPNEIAAQGIARTFQNLALFTWDVRPWKHHGGSDHEDAFQHFFPGPLLGIQPERGDRAQEGRGADH